MIDKKSELVHIAILSTEFDDNVVKIEFLSFGINTHVVFLGSLFRHSLHSRLAYMTIADLDLVLLKSLPKAQSSNAHDIVFILDILSGVGAICFLGGVFLISVTF